MAEPAALKYRAFISYSHADTSWAKWLHRGLEGFRIDKDLVGNETPTGAIPKTLRPVFRDRDEFSAGHTLRELTLVALDASAALIVICSPAATKSSYVNKEIGLFKSRHPERPVIPLIVAGKSGDPELKCFPSMLKFKLDAEGQITDELVEVLAADAREEGDGKVLALAKVVAGLLDLSADDVFASSLCKTCPASAGLFVYERWLPRGYSRLLPSRNVHGGTTLCADLVSLQQSPLLYSFRLPHLPATAMVIRVMDTVMDMATAITITAMSKTIGTIVSIGMLRSAVVGGAVVGGATVKALAGGGLRAATSGFAAKHCNSGCRASAPAGALFMLIIRRGTGARRIE